MPKPTPFTGTDLLDNDSTTIIDKKSLFGVHAQVSYVCVFILMCEALPPTLHSKQRVCGKRYARLLFVDIVVEEASMCSHVGNAFTRISTSCMACGLHFIEYAR